MSPVMTLATVTWLVLAAAACHDQNILDEKAAADRATLSGEELTSSADKMSGETAIKLVKALAEAGNLRATVAQIYTETHVTRSACGEAELVYDRNTYPQDPGQWLCQSKTGAMPFFKYTAKDVTKCCHSKEVSFPATTRWSASRSADSASWHVTGSFDLQGVPQQATWRVDAQTQKVRELPDSGANSIRPS